MKTYNKIMEWFWLSVSILILIVVTVMGIRDGFDRWVFYYAFALMAGLTYLMRRFMRRRMEKHVQWLEQERQKADQQS